MAQSQTVNYFPALREFYHSHFSLIPLERRSLQLSHATSQLLYAVTGFARGRIAAAMVFLAAFVADR